MRQVNVQSLSRRRLLGKIVLAGSALGVLPLLQACSATPSAPPAAAPTQAPAATQAAAVNQAPAATSAPVQAANATQAPAASASQPRTGGTLRYGLNTDVQRMSQLNTTWMTDATQHLYDRPLTRDPDGKYVPHIASWDISADKLTWTFNLKPGVKFHTGAPFNADALKWWFDQARDPNGFYGFKGSYASVNSVETQGDLTTVVKLKHPDAALQFMLYTVYSSIINPATFQKLGKDDYGVKTVDGTGPFKFQEWTPGNQLVVVRNAEYKWAPPFAQNQAAPYLDSIVYKYYSDDTARTAAVQSGEADIIVQPNLADVDRLKQDPNLTIISKPMPAARVVTFNTTKAPWSDKRVRQAMASAIQRDPIIQKLLFNQGIPASSIIPPIFTDMFLEDTKSYFPYDINKAKDLLKQAGLETGGADGSVQLNGQTWEPEMLVTSQSELAQLAQVVQAQAANIGIQLKITQLDQESMQVRTNKGDYDVATSFYLWDGPDTMYDWWFDSGNIPATNSVFLKDSTVDGLIDKMRNAGTLDDRYAAVKELQKVIHGDLVPVIPVYHPLDIYVLSKKVHGYTPNPYTLYPRMHDVWMEA